VNLVATNRTAALSGLWCALGLVPFDTLYWSRGGGRGLIGALVVVGVLIVFLAIPFRVFVFGQQERLSRWWLFDSNERARMVPFSKRAFIWVVSLAAVGSLWSLVLTRLSRGST
jgi:hypothetical protein